MDLNNLSQFSSTIFLIAIMFSVIGSFIVRKTVLYLRDKYKIYNNDFSDLDLPQKKNKIGKDDYNRATPLLGALELLCYFLSVIFGFVQFIGWWLAVKMAGRWSPGGPPPEVEPIKEGDSPLIKKEKCRKAGAALNIFLIGNLLNIIFGVGGGLTVKYYYLFSQLPFIIYIDHFMTFKFFFDLSALLCTVPTAFLAFKERFITNFTDQCKEAIKRGNLDYKSAISFRYRILADFILGVKGNEDWLDIFASTDTEVQKKKTYDKSDAVRGLIWFILAFIFAFISLIFRY